MPLVLLLVAIPAIFLSGLIDLVNLIDVDNDSLDFIIYFMLLKCV